MKELSIEEKAKRYDEAIKLVNSKWYYKNQPCFINVSELFPEFKENKNENIRKWLIEYFQEYKSTGIEGFANGLKIDSIIAWLEKQINDEDIHLLKLKAKAYDDSKERMSYAYNQNRVPIGFMNEIFPNLDLYKTQDKIEPKFKVGDWIVFNGITLLVNDVVQGYCYYRTISINGNYHRYDWNIDNAARLWTIEDAKEGNVISYKDEILLYKHDIKNYSKQQINFGGFVYYCCYDGKRFIVNGIHSLIEQDKIDIHPATKEQRDLLFAQIKKAGYKWKWNGNKKELIKL